VVYNLIRRNFQHHPFHLVSPSPWPVFTSLSLGSLAAASAMSMHYFQNSYILFYIALILVVMSMVLWFRDIVTEGTFLGDHTISVQRGLTLGFILFVVSEVLFFLSVFWAYFHSSLTPNIEMGCSWPPVGIDPVNPFELPLLNTVILLSSGATITWSHHSLIGLDRKGALWGAFLTVILAMIFSGFQAVEYYQSSFTISDGVFGSCFFFATGFHGLHVIIGLLFLAVGLWRIYAYHLTNHHHNGYESAILYWHFVDVVWLVLYVSIYYWGS